ncbi:hypothetical protein PQR62_23080 [Herbaspirillum lusitanum]|uniref:Uncharacterized protein n=1 Tax=Herbaspirillum lusitanum TaxID=213312 RepID=A0ABW9AFH6_9BURK
MNIGILMLIFSTCVQANTFGGLEHEVNFAPRSAELSAKEIRALVDWKMNAEKTFPEADFYVSAKSNDDMGIDDELAQKRLDQIVLFLKQTNRRLSFVDIDHRRGKYETGQMIDFMNAVLVGVQPACTRTANCGAEEGHPVSDTER